MLEVYSVNQTVAESGYIPLNNVTIKKGITATNSAPATIELNRCGVYMVSCDAVASPTEAGIVSVQLYKNGIAQPQAQSSFTGTVGNSDTLGFTTLVQVPENNTCCCCTSPTTLQIVNTGVEATYTAVNVVVTKVC